MVFEVELKNKLKELLEGVRNIVGSRSEVLIGNDGQIIFPVEEFDSDEIPAPQDFYELSRNREVWMEIQGWFFCAFSIEFEGVLVLAVFQPTSFSKGVQEGLIPLLKNQFSSLVPIFRTTTIETNWNEIKYKNLFNALTQGVVYHDHTGQIIANNPAAERILKLSSDQILGKTSIDPTWHTIHEDGSKFPGEEHPAMVALRTGKEVRNVVMGVKSGADDSVNWIVSDAIPENLPDSKTPHHVLVSFSEITQIKAIKSQIKEKKAVLTEIMESANESIWALDLNYRLLYANQLFFERFKLLHKSEISINDQILSFLSYEMVEKWEGYFNQVFQGEELLFNEHYQTSSMDYYLETTIKPIYSGAKIIGAAAFSKNISDMAKHIQIIESQNSKLREIAWIQSHLVRAPLARIMGIVNAIENFEEHEVQEHKSFIGLLKKASLELDEIIRDVVKKSETID